MPRYFMHIFEGADVTRDADGRVLADLEAARREAIAGARDILAEQLKAGEELDGQHIVIVDESDRVLDTIYFRDVYRLPETKVAAARADDAPSHRDEDFSRH